MKNGIRWNLRGEIAELMFCQKALELGWEVCKPLADLYGYDFIAKVDEVWKRCQVKTVKLWEKRPGYFYKVCDFTYGRRKEPIADLFDYLVVVDIVDGAIYMIPVDDITGTRYITITDYHKKYKL